MKKLVANSLLPKGYRYSVRFRIGSRLGTKSAYTFKEVCVCIVDRYSLTEREIVTIACLKPGEFFSNEILEIRRI